MTPHRHPHPVSVVRQASRLRPHRLALALACALAAAGSPAGAQTHSLPAGAAVVHGQASIVTQGSRMTVSNSPNAVLNWQSFSIGAGHSVHFEQAGASSQVLNRVLGRDPSQIAGRLSSNGAVWLLNPYGVVFGPDARVDVAGLVASTLNISDADWRSRRYSLLGGDSVPDRVVVAEAGPGCARIARQLEQRASGRRIVGRQILELRVAARLVIGDHEGSVTGPVDPVDRTLQLDAAAVGQTDHDVVVATEAHLGGEHRRTAFAHQEAVVLQPRQQIGAHAVAFVAPERRPPRAAATLGAFAHFVERRAERGAVLVGPSGLGGLGQDAVDDGAVEQVERAVMRGAAVEGCDADLVVRFLDGVDLEQVVGEVGMGAGNP